MKSLRLSVKMCILTGVAIVISAISVEILCLNLFRKAFSNNIKENLETIELGINSTIKDRRDILEYAVVALAGRPNIIEAIEAEDYNEVAALAKEKQDIVGMDIMVVTDAQGRAISGVARGSDLSKMACVKDIIVDRMSVARTYESSSYTNYGMLVATEIKNDSDDLIGVLLAGFDFTHPDFINEMKNVYKIELTVFEDTLRVGTTLVDHATGRSMTGTRLDNQEIINHVLRNGDTYETNIVLGGQNHLNIYFPLKTELGKITGMISTAKSTQAINDVVNMAIRVSGLFLVALCAIMCVIGAFIIISLLKPLKGVKDTLTDISSGDADLTKRIPLKTKDEIGDVVVGFNTFAGKLQDIIKEMKGSKDVLDMTGEDLQASTADTASSIAEILANIDSIHRQINEQKASVDQTAGAVDEISANIVSLNNMIENQSSGVAEASAAVEEMIGNISSVNGSMEKMSSAFEDLGRNAQSGFTKLQDVHDKIQQIEGQSQLLQEANTAIASIASQTNLLAMNAAIEAAHAGEAGKGFAVVADEIRKLSETSTTQSKTIGTQLSQIQEAIKNVVTASNEASQAFSIVSKELDSTDQLVIQIRSAMEEQNEGSRQITDALKIMNDSTVEVRDASKEMNEGNKVILEEVQHLQDTTGVMKASMDEMHIGAQKINETGTALSEIASKVKESIDRMGKQVDQFRV